MGRLLIEQESGYIFTFSTNSVITEEYIMYTLHYAALTHPGRVPENNEDNFYINGAYKSDPKAACFQAKGTVRGGRLTASVCDGMGGYAAGEESSLIAVRTMAEFCRKEKKDEVLFRDRPMDYINEANARICRLREQAGKPTGSTLTVMEFADGAFTAVNIGDSRIYMYRDGAFVQLSTDHSVVARMTRMGQITQEEAKTHPLRHQITQHFGIRPEEMVLEPAVVQEEIRAGDMYLLCSDGLTDMVSDEEILKALGEDLSLNGKVKRLVQQAVDAGGRDNITAALIEAEKRQGLMTRLRERFVSRRTGEGEEDEG